MPIYAKFQKASFSGINFPYSQITIQGGLRHHVHEFPHSAGGDLEKMGRKVYVIRFRCPFHDLPGSDLEQSFPQLFPNRLQNLIALFDKETTAELVVPSLGTIKVAATDWQGRAEMSEALSGETWDIEFTEDEERASLIKDIPKYGVAAMRAAGDNLAEQAKKAYDEGRVPGLFELINDAITEVDGVLGEADAYTRLVAAKIHAVADLCGRADREIDELQSPMNHVLLEALKSVWANAVDLSENFGETQDILVYRVPKLMGIGQVSANVYGTTERAFEIMQFNAIPDPFAIPAGTELNYLSDAA